MDRSARNDNAYETASSLPSQPVNKSVQCQASAQASNAAAQAHGGQGLPVDPRPHSLGRGRGQPIFNPDHPQRNPQPRPPNLGRDITPPPRPGNDDAEYNELRDRVLCDLLRRERQPAEGARVPKAIHNWPFKFRGTKDSTNLNTFLDRVESFAFSEGVNNAMLLRAIKHLLQDDALDWYSRALNEGELDTWENFKLMIRQEYLSSHYGQLLREEASSRYQGANEIFQKYYRDISALFRFVQPPMSQEDKFFILKKNMNPEYATILASARPQTIQDMVEVCNAYDDTRTLLTHQRRTPIPHSSLLEPNLATPSGSQRSQANNAGWQRFGGRVNAIDSREENQDRRGRYDATSADQRDNLDEDDWTEQIEQLTQQICAIRTQFQKRSNEQYRRGGNYAGQRWQSHQQQPVAEEQQPMGARNNHQQSESAQPRVNQRSPEQVATRPSAEQRQGTLLCWNCDEEGHRFTDCDKAQAVFFCYRCGRKGYTLRNCPECYAEQGNGPAGSHDNRPHATINILGKEITGLLDSGANCSLLGGAWVDIVDELQLKRGTLKGGIQTADGTKHEIEEFANLPIAYNGRHETIPVLLIPSLPNSLILGMNFWEAFGVKAICCSITTKPIETEPHPEPMRELNKQEQWQLDKAIAKFPCSREGMIGRTTNAKHEATGVSPHFANFGRDLILHTDLYKQQDLNAPDDPKLAQDLRLSKLKRIHEFVIQKIKNNHEKSKQRYNLRTRAVSFKVGELVWRKLFSLSSKADHVNQKLNPKYVPAIVKVVLGHNLYELEDISSGKRGRYHAKDLKSD
ncbi:hypothetical protein pipiens_015913 [Culex pipiens pipiens]|uniref:CCHC-type domain-containing protein n=1 Tax=Culex pipiens pipiens TaxID=38569 RepID=A0ABD1CNF4_CULPP